MKVSPAVNEVNLGFHRVSHLIWGMVASRENRGLVRVGAGWGRCCVRGGGWCGAAGGGTVVAGCP